MKGASLFKVRQFSGHAAFFISALKRLSNMLSVPGLLPFESIPSTLDRVAKTLFLQGGSPQAGNICTCHRVTTGVHPPSLTSASRQDFLTGGMNTGGWWFSLWWHWSHFFTCTMTGSRLSVSFLVVIQLSSSPSNMSISSLPERNLQNLGTMNWEHRANI